MLVESSACLSIYHERRLKKWSQTQTVFLLYMGTFTLVSGSEAEPRSLWSRNIASMQSVGMVRVFYPHLNRLTGNVKMGVLPPIVDRHWDWVNAKTASDFLSALHVQSEICGQEELLISRIRRLLDVPVYSDQDRTNNTFYVAVALTPDLYYARLSHVPWPTDMNHPYFMFLAVQALCDAGMVTTGLIRHIYCVVLPTCDRSHILWYNILTMFLDDLRRTLAISDVLLNQTILNKHSGLVPTLVCCLEKTLYIAEWTVGNGERKSGTQAVHSVVQEHRCKPVAGGLYKYINKAAALEVAVNVFRDGQRVSSSRLETSPRSHMY